MPWIVMGDFNAIAEVEDRLGGSQQWLPTFEEFKVCINKLGITDLRHSGCRYTWSNGMHGQSRIQRKINRFLVNGDWLDQFSSFHTRFLVNGVSDHSPMITTVASPPLRKSPFRFFKFWINHPEFKNTVEKVWDGYITGYAMYKVVSKLKLLKQELRHLNKKHFHEISRQIEDARCKLDDLQSLLQTDPHNPDIAVAEDDALHRFMELRRMEESFFRQKSRVLWLQEGDKNTSYFHSHVKNRNNKNRISELIGSDGAVSKDPEAINKHVVSYFQRLFTFDQSIATPNHSSIASVLGRRIFAANSAMLTAPITPDKVKLVIHSLGKGKASGPDGYGVEFFLETWDIVGGDVPQAVCDFFANGKILGDVNSTSITLIPKCPNPSSIYNFRPISCCNTLCKCILNILAMRLAAVLLSIISPSHAAFVKGRRITDHILLTQELMKGYHLKPYLPKCTLKYGRRITLWSGY